MRSWLFEQRNRVGGYGLLLFLFALPLLGMAEELKVGAACFEKYEKLLQGKRVALVCNHTSRVGERMLYDTLRERGIKLVRLFTPEHGLEGIADAGERVRSSKSRKDFPEIVSLYDHNKRLPLDKLKGIDIVLFDLQDVGVRCYTYISTMHYVMEACAQSNVPFVVLDRPNPNGYFVDGTVLELKYKSFVGMHPVPWVHGLTVGEYARMIVGEEWLGESLKLQLTVIRTERVTYLL